MWKRKVLMQMIACAVIFSGYHLMSTSDNIMLEKWTQEAVSAVSAHYTGQDIKEACKNAAETIVKAPAAVTSFIISSGNTDHYGIPIDETEAGETTSVYAVAGGEVLETGENSQIGTYVKILHEEAVSTYGNCRKLYVEEGDRVRKGQVIASFYKDKTGDFYYDLTEIEP